MTLGDEGPLRDVVSSEVQAAGFDLEDLTVTGAGRRRVVRVVVDSDDGVDLDAAAALSRRLSERLDEAGDEVLGGSAYTLEVTSPGVGRPLTLPRHFRRATGRLVTLTLAGGETMQVRVLRVDGDDLVVLTGPDGTLERVVGLAAIVRAWVEVEFAPPPAAVAALLAASAATLATPELPPPTPQADAGPSPDAGPRPADKEGNDAR